MKIATFTDGESVPENAEYITTTVQRRCLHPNRIPDVEIPCHKAFHHYLIPN